MTDGSLQRRLVNWGNWLNHDAEIGPADAKCISIESRHIADDGEIWEPAPIKITPDVPEAHTIQAALDKLDHIHGYALAIRYGGYQAVMRYIRLGEHAQQKLADSAEKLLSENLLTNA